MTLANVQERRMADGTDARARIDQYLADAGLAAHEPRVVPLTGDASDRRYFRILLRDRPSQVLALHAGPIEFESLAFVNVARLLQAMPLPVPRIAGHSDELGVIALEDLGDVTLQAHLGAASPAETAALYRQAVTFIEALQRRGRELQSHEYTPYAIRFDVEKLTWELQFFTRHFLEAYRGIALDAAASAALSDEYRSIVEELASEARVLCHRDYHSRNLMLHQGSLYIIDFQDARLGPDTYDLVSLLRDSYVDLAEQQVEELIAFFLALRGGFDNARAAGPGTTAADQQEFRRRFDLMALQRNLKALGTFGFQTTGRANPVYIQYIPRTLSHVKANLGRYPRFGRLRELLARYLEELR
jgi:aminoglycoside/choline kinase family phosphotransferase